MPTNAQLMPSNTQLIYPVDSDSRNILESSNIIGSREEEEGEFDYGIELNPMWTERFAATLSKMEKEGKSKKTVVKKVSSVQKNKAKNKRKKAQKMETEKRLRIDN